jgi:hypothetical protein
MAPNGDCPYYPNHGFFSALRLAICSICEIGGPLLSVEAAYPFFLAVPIGSVLSTMSAFI